MYFPILSEELAKEPQKPRNHRVVIHWISCLGVFFGWLKHPVKTKRQNERQDSWLFGYGFSYVYRRCAALAKPFRHCHFGEELVLSRFKVEPPSKWKPRIHIMLNTKVLR